MQKKKIIIKALISPHCNFKQQSQDKRAQVDLLSKVQKEKHCYMTRAFFVSSAEGLQNLSYLFALLISELIVFRMRQSRRQMFQNSEERFSPFDQDLLKKASLIKSQLFCIQLFLSLGARKDLSWLSCSMSERRQIDSS